MSTSEENAKKALNESINESHTKEKDLLFSNASEILKPFKNRISFGSLLDLHRPPPLTVELQRNLSYGSLAHLSDSNSHKIVEPKSLTMENMLSPKKNIGYRST